MKRWISQSGSASGECWDGLGNEGQVKRLMGEFIRDQGCQEWWEKFGCHKGSLGSDGRVGGSDEGGLGVIREVWGLKGKLGEL